MVKILAHCLHYIIDAIEAINSNNPVIFAVIAFCFALYLLDLTNN
jgi:hypothetical protein